MLLEGGSRSLAGSCYTVLSPEEFSIRDVNKTYSTPAGQPSNYINTGIYYFSSWVEFQKIFLRLSANSPGGLEITMPEVVKLCGDENSTYYIKRETWHPCGTPKEYIINCGLML
jgi:dTDP-glucose pyrophosphorylase